LNACTRYQPPYLPNVLAGNLHALLETVGRVLVDAYQQATARLGVAEVHKLRSRYALHMRTIGIPIAIHLVGQQKLIKVHLQTWKEWNAG
jgi:hypothetical protein